jgi:hypothetical protein
MDDELKSGPKPKFTDAQIEEAHRLYFIEQIGRFKAAEQMGLDPAQVVYLARLRKMQLAEAKADA